MTPKALLKSHPERHDWKARTHTASRVGRAPVQPRTETVYRNVIVPEIRWGATVMDAVFNDDEDDQGEGNGDAKNA